jgi:hypothetical protein
MAVPFMDYKEERTALQSWSEVKGEEPLIDYRQQHNMKSIDGIRYAHWIFVQVNDERQE